MLMRRRIYVLNGIPPEVIAVAFAKCSRSPEPFDQIARELNDDKTRQFHEKWIVGYGHSSVAEHAVLSIAIEGVSILATKVIEDSRLASYTEKSTRYQVFDKSTYYKPAKLQKHTLGKIYTKAADKLMDTYTEIVPLMIEHFERKVPRDPTVPLQLYNTRIKNMALDSCRYLLPVSTLTNLGMTVNARELAHAISKLLTHPLDEMHDIGDEMKQAASGVTPTLLKYTERNEYIEGSGKELEELSRMLTERKGGVAELVELVEFDKEAEHKLIAAILYRFSHQPYRDIKLKMMAMPAEQKEAVINAALCKLGKHDSPLRELEHAHYTFDILVDYGAFRDIQRHRMVTQTNQELTVAHGYSVPDAIVDAGLKDRYVECMDKAADAFLAISSKFPREAQYVVPLAYKKRVLFTCNLRELFHFIKLRSGPTAHESYKAVARRMFELVREKQPMLARYMTCG
jgi:thymidylate synthase ThyX